MVKVNFELYKTFFAVANELNVTKASELLHISQPAVTQSIKKLEEELGTVLFIRTKRGVILTEEGTVLYRYIKEAINIINSGENKLSEFKNLESGSIKIGISTTLTREFLMPYLEKFHETHPNITIGINTSLTSDLMPLLQKGLIDVVVLNLPFKTSKDIKIIPCHKIQDCFVVNNKFKHLTEKILPLEEINKYPLILQTKQSNTRTFVDDWCYKNGVVLNPNMEVASYSLVTMFSKIGMGIGYATKEYIKKELEAGELYEIKTVPSIPPRTIGLAIKENIIPSPSAKKLIDMVINNY